MTEGSTGVAIAERRTVNVGNVAAAPRGWKYTIGNHYSVFNATRDEVTGTIDVETCRSGSDF